MATPTRPDRARLQALGLDLTEHGDADSIEVILYGSADAQRLRDAGSPTRCGSPTWPPAMPPTAAPTRATRSSRR
ncbi:MAG: hypothetical protein ACRD0N_06690 [Acidimicrobiales bacterium]